MKELSNQNDLTLTEFPELFFAYEEVANARLKSPEDHYTEMIRQTRLAIYAISNRNKWPDDYLTSVLIATTKAMRNELAKRDIHISAYEYVDSPN